MRALTVFTNPPGAEINIYQYSGNIIYLSHHSKVLLA